MSNNPNEFFNEKAHARTENTKLVKYFRKIQMMLKIWVTRYTFCMWRRVEREPCWYSSARVR